MTIKVVLIPFDPSRAVQYPDVSWDDDKEDQRSNDMSHGYNDDMIMKTKIASFLSAPGERMKNNEGYNADTVMDNIVDIPLLRPYHENPGIYAYYIYPTNDQTYSIISSSPPNIRATRLAMACGLLSLRLYGDVIICRKHPTQQPQFHDLTIQDIYGSCQISPDLRSSIQFQILNDESTNFFYGNDDNPSQRNPPIWLTNAAKQNYHDAAAVQRMVQVMKFDKSSSSDNDDADAEEIETEGDSDNSDRGEIRDKIDDKISPYSKQADHNNDSSKDNVISADKESITVLEPQKFVAKSPLCMHCRRPATQLCPDCQGAYFCSLPRRCRTLGWTHKCQCRTWKVYTSRRQELSTFDYLAPNWQSQLVGRDFQLSEEPYKQFIQSLWEIQSNRNSDEECSYSTSWWRTETDGWAGGHSISAQQVDPTIRKSYQEGFSPLPIDQIPSQRGVFEEDFVRASLYEENGVGLRRLKSWTDYYKLRNIPPNSPVALLCTFPLTMYYAIVEFGEVPVTIARMLKRPLRIHVIGAEKELNFLDLFQEVAYVLPEDLELDLVFVVRQDMLPAQCVKNKTFRDSNDKFLLRFEMTSNLTIGIISGIYGISGDGSVIDKIDPNFDCGSSGPPDMVLAFNAGLYAYESWRSVIDYLHYNTGVIGIFTDYNEYSGMNCAAIGGSESRESLKMNPFRQPLAMPVYSMNLPQFSNGFTYVFNPQELD